MDALLIILISVALFAIGLFIGWMLKSMFAGESEELDEMDPPAETVKKAVREEIPAGTVLDVDEKMEEVEQERRKLESEIQEKMISLKERENQLDRTEKDMEAESNKIKKLQKELDSSRRELEEKRTAVNDKREHLDRQIEEYEAKLQRMSGFTREEAKRLLMSNLRSKVKFEAAQMIKEIKDDARLKGEEEAKKIIAMAVLRLASEETTELTTNEIELPNDFIKGRIIGKDGKNIKSFEKEAGVKVIVDETPRKIILSSFDAVKREIAKMAMNRLIESGKFHPDGIKKAIRGSESDMENRIVEAGRNAVNEVGLRDVHPELVKLMGRMKFRTSYGQNVLRHSIEVSKLTAAMAAELNLDVEMAKRAGFFHDIGKAIDRDTEGAHPEIGITIAEKYNEPEIVINAIASHHEDVEATSIIPVLVAAADAVSGSRPGARRRSVADYVHRIEELEHVANSVTGVVSSYAIQAGREIRVIAQEDRIHDNEVEHLATEIANRIQSEMEYPGKIKVVVIREKKAVEYAN